MLRTVAAVERMPSVPRAVGRSDGGSPGTPAVRDGAPSVDGPNGSSGTGSTARTGVGSRTSNGVQLDPRLPDPVAGVDYVPEQLNSNNPRVRDSHVNGYVAELRLANEVAALPDTQVIKYGDRVGVHGSDIISVNTTTGEVTLWDSNSEATRLPCLLLRLSSRVRARWRTR